MPQLVAPVISPEADIWMSRLTPIAGLAIQQTVDRAGQVIGPWEGLGVLCACAVAALVLARWQLSPPGRLMLVGRALRAEWTKLRTVPSTGWTLIAVVVADGSDRCSGDLGSHPAGLRARRIRPATSTCPGSAWPGCTSARRR